MHQLDLFGSFFETTPLEKNPEEQPVPQKTENNSSVLKTEEISYSLVELAEETLGAKTSYGSDEIIIHQELGKKSSQQSEQKQEVFFQISEISKEHISTLTIIEKSRTDPCKSEMPHDSEDKKKDDELKQKVVNIPEPLRNGTVIFDNGKIAVKVKNKNIAADTGIKGKEKIEPQKIEPKEVEPEKIDQQKKEPQKRGRKSLQEIEAEVDLIEVPDDEELFQKQYYTISQVAKWFRVNTSLLRFWENEFEILKPKKNRKGDRLFRPEDVKNLQLIYQLLRERKYTIEGAKEYIKTNRKKADLELQLTITLQKFKSFLLDLKANLHS
jgi:DNA-binding transcriptional MerR regulator/formylmethanofuran dehydrogenase subunit E